MSLFSTYNYLVPAIGTTSAYALNNINSNAQPLDFSRVSSDTGQAFNPSGVQIDNTAGTIPVVLVVQPNGFTISCPVGKQMGMQFPAPAGCTVLVTGNGANLAFVDYPVIPYQF
jgi:hypothetical protein